ncbi:MAG: carbohydrate-binding family 9-like protein [Myxococcota bacterium]
MRTRRAWAVLGLFVACGDPTSPSPPSSESFSSPVVQTGVLGSDAWSHAIQFEGGVKVDGVRTSPQVEPGGTLDVHLTAHGPVEGLTARLTAWPPRAGSRQVARGGVGAPPVEVPIDPRARVQTVALVAGPQSIPLVLPEPWHPRQVLLTLELLEGSTRVRAYRGPRREDGVAVLALADVAVRPVAVVAVSMPTPPQLDGRLDEPGWARARAHPMVHSLDGEPYDERPGTVRWAWDPQALYVAAQIEDPDVWSEYTRHDEPLWKQEVFEVFVFGDAGRRDYLELQVSPRGITFDARFEQYRKGDEAWDGRWQAAVSLSGTLDDRRDRDQGWSVELAIPWDEICAHTEVTCPPRPGQTLVVNAFRFERPHKRPPVGLALSPPRVPDFHAPANAAVLELGGA